MTSPDHPKAHHIDVSIYTQIDITLVIALQKLRCIGLGGFSWALKIKDKYNLIEV